MDNGYGSDDEVTSAERSAADAPAAPSVPPVPPTRRFPSSNIGRPRIQGVEAGVAAGLVPPGQGGQGAQAGSGTGGAAGETANPRHLARHEPQPIYEEPIPDDIAEGVELPDWTDPPTREVPRVLLRPDSDPTPAIRGPVWRESERDFDEDREAFAEIVSDSVPVIAHEDAVRDDDFDFGEVYDPHRIPLGRERSAMSDATELQSALPYREGGSSHSDPGSYSDPGSHVERPSDARDQTTYPGDQTTYADDRTTFVGRGSRSGSGARAGAAGSGSGGHGSGLGSGVRFAGRKVTIGRAQTAGPLPAPRAAAEQPDDPSGGGQGRNPFVAIRTGLIVGAAALLCFWAGPPFAMLIAAVVLLLASAECFQALRKSRYQPATMIGLVAAPGFAVAAYLKGPEAIPIVGALAVAAVMCWYLVGVTRQSVVANLSVSVLGIAWIAGFGAFAGLLLDPTAFPHRHGIAYLLGAVIATVAYDVGGYAVGSLLGRHKLAPTVSPNKTWEGLIGGSAAAFLFSVVLVAQIHPWTYAHAAVLGIVVAVVAPIGDLVESLIKRDLNLKDMGSILPAHGGALDRVDALLFVLPATYVVVRLFHG